MNEKEIVEASAASVELVAGVAGAFARLPEVDGTQVDKAVDSQQRGQFPQAKLPAWFPQDREPPGRGAVCKG